MRPLLPGLVGLQPLGPHPHPGRPGQSTRVELRPPTRPAIPIWPLLCAWPPDWTASSGASPPPEEITENIYAMDDAARAARGIESLPDSLSSAIKELQKDQLLMWMPWGSCLLLLHPGQKKEWYEYKTRVSSWEREKYITLY